LDQIYYRKRGLILKVGKVIKVSGPLVVAEGMEDANVYDVVEVSDNKLIGEIIEMRGDKASIQVYEETTGIGPGDVVVSTGSPLSIELGPGMIEQMFDGIQRPLEALQAKAGDFLLRGVSVLPLNREKKWDFVPTVNVGDEVSEGNVIGTVQETSVVSHKIMVPPSVSGKIVEINSGEHTVDEIIIKYIKFRKSRKVYSYAIPRKEPTYTTNTTINFENILGMKTNVNQGGKK